MNPSDLLFDLGFYSVDGSLVLDKTSVDIRIGSHNHNRCSVKGSCDGLVCLKECVTGTTLIWNPSTRDFKVLPSPSEGGLNVRGKYELWRYGFGYDYNSDDYKVLTLIPYQISFGNSGSYKSIIYTLRSDSWRRIQDSPLGIFFHNTPSTFASGSLHWTAEKTGCVGVIVAFDLASERYKEVPLPRADIKSYKLQLGASRGSLCLLTAVDDGSYDMWEMREYGVPESWTKTVTFPRKLGTVEYPMILKPLTWSIEKGKILLYANGNPVSYNASKNSLVHFARDVNILSSVGYEESLVSPNAYNNLGANKICPLNIRIVLRKHVNCSDRSRKFVQIK
uniref:F-box protein CPR30-like n=1 Tax=Fragaria vesca subsp. vesca TaxID=101020 RepID=UPI0005C85881|nr:PREDICTED: F-box protein CPR30-like [Fragaria vesca subsp. vesca]